jgi:hypothetical protein
MENKLYRTLIVLVMVYVKKVYVDQLYKNYPKQWAYMSDIEKRLFDERTLRGEDIRPSFSTSLFTWDMEKLFKQKDKQATFEFEFEAVQDCFCKI